MKVGFDISQIAHSGGVSTYTTNLTSQLDKIPDLQMIYFYSSLRKPIKSVRNIKSYRLPPSLFEILFNRWRNIPIEKFIGDVDIFHSSDWIQPPTKAKKVTTFHDIVPLKYPTLSHPKIVDVFKRRLKLVEKEIDMVICVSQSTKNDLLKISNIPENKIVVIHEGPSANFKVLSRDKINAFKQKYNLPDNFILAIGGIGKRRNLDRIKSATKDYNLVIAGKTIPWLNMDELELLYNSAQVLLYCSLYEGFGLPILDAFSCGLPVITSNISSMPEVGGEAAIYVDPQSVEDIKNKTNLVTGDEGLRKTMIEKGLKKVREFSWEKSAGQTADVYRSLMK